MVSPIGDVAFLARSATRVEVLRALTERPRERRELATSTDTPRSTLGRTLGELEERGWIERNGRIYEITTAGTLLVERFAPLLETVAVLQKLGDAVELLPMDEGALEVEDLADARFVTPTGMNPTAPFDHGIERLSEATRFRCVAQTAPPRYAEAINEGAVSGRFTAECVLDGTYLDDLEDDPASNERWREVAEGPSTVRRSEEPISFVLLILDGTVHLWLCDGKGENQGLVESTNPAVISWANETVDRYLERSRAVEWGEIADRPP
ncbi:MAG: helix-turn-helix transcriptional regulator [Halobacteriota archaeon]